MRTRYSRCLLLADCGRPWPAFAANSFELEGAALSPTALVITQPLQLEILNQPE